MIDHYRLIIPLTRSSFVGSHVVTLSSLELARKLAKSTWKIHTYRALTPTPTPTPNIHAKHPRITSIRSKITLPAHMSSMGKCKASTGSPWYKKKGDLSGPPPLFPQGQLKLFLFLC